MSENTVKKVNNQSMGEEIAKGKIDAYIAEIPVPTAGMVFVK